MSYLALGLSVVVLGFTLWMAVEVGLHVSVLIGLFMSYMAFGIGVQMIDWSNGKED